MFTGDGAVHKQTHKVQKSTLLLLIVDHSISTMQQSPYRDCCIPIASCRTACPNLAMDTAYEGSMVQRASDQPLEILTSCYGADEVVTKPWLDLQKSCRNPSNHHAQYYTASNEINHYSPGKSNLQDPQFQMLSNTADACAWGKHW